jgi:hypothetical protein
VKSAYCFTDRVAFEGADRDLHRQLEAGRAPGFLPLAPGISKERNAKFNDQVTFNLQYVICNL